MNRSTAKLAAGLALGAAIMYAATNLRVRVEVAESPTVVAQPAPPRVPDQFPLPPLPQSPAGFVRPASAADPVPPLTTDAPVFKALTVATGRTIQFADDLSSRDLPIFRSNSAILATVVITAPKDAKKVALQVDNGKIVEQPVTDATRDVTFSNVDLGLGREHVIKATAATDTMAGKTTQLQVNVRALGAGVEGYSAFGFGSGGATDQIVIRFTAGSQLRKDTVQTLANYALKGLNGLADPVVTNAIFDPISDTVTLTVTGVKPGSYALALPRTGTILDLYGNALQPVASAPEAVFFTTTLFTQTLEQVPLPTQGVALQHGPYVPMYEYQPRPPSPNGFNPSDKVESRVVRLYYYRDAHRVAMIVNRSVKSYAAAAVEVRARAAERARDDADKHTIERKRLQMAAVRAAQDARAAEAELQNAQNRTASGLSESARASRQLETKQLELEQAKRDLAAAPTNQTLIDRVKALEQEALTLRRVASVGEAAASNAGADAARLQQQVQALRDAEVKATEAWQVKELEETRLRANEFRLDVAAATTDPVTYAPGVPDSYDPVQQVSVSVIGEGLIQLRGPMKGINIIRIMINQIDAPVGQVRIAVHTVQVNGERGNRMEKVVANIQRYIDHSRFLTAQTSQMLKNAVTRVAARKAEEVAAELGPNCSQEARDRKYLHAFFGKDFIDELMLLDSEFLKTGNKLLSLHSMDSTSLSAALFLLALAKNDVRREILADFQAQLEADLPQMEFNYYLAGLTPTKCEACCDKKHYLMAYNAKFQSFLGFFNTEIAGADTMTPLQREFIRLAQIFKAHLVTEITLKQRVLERSLVEERIGGDYREELRKAKEAEDTAKAELSKIQQSLITATAEAQNAVVDLFAQLDQLIDELETATNSLENYDTLRARAAKTREVKGRPWTLPKVEKATIGPNSGKEVLMFADAEQYRAMLMNIGDLLNGFYYKGRATYERYSRLQELIKKATDKTTGAQLTPEEYDQLQRDVKWALDLVRAEGASARAALNEIAQLLQMSPPDPAKAAARYRVFRDDIQEKLRPGAPLERKLIPLFTSASAAFDALSRNSAGYQAALQKARLLRRPLDEKKLLDLLVDDTEDKFIEQLEGTRAHTANVDNYIKAITTALDDDFNTQFYNPAFRKVREASRLWDVTLGQIETTSVLTNNRAFAKVSPSATMEFDLPKRDIMITEGFRSAKALFDEYGALMNDPTFLALGKLYSGVPSTGQFNTGGDFSAVRNVIPGLPSVPDESVMAQQGPGKKEFGTALEALIPDPAIYKFETGTGYEIRPVVAPDGQAVVFNFQYLYTTDVREPVRADEKHLGRVKRHFVHTDVQLSNFELREVSKYMVALKAARTAKGVPLLQDVPGLGILFRPLPSAESSLQENIIYSQATIFPTLFDLMGLRYAQSIADLDPLATRVAEFAARNRELDLMQRTADIGATRVDDAVRTPFGERRQDLYRPQVTIPYVHPNGYMGPGLRQRDSSLIEGPVNPYDPRQAYPDTRYSPYQSWPSATKPLPPEAYLPPPGGMPLGTTILPGTPKMPLPEPRRLPPTPIQSPSMLPLPSLPMKGSATGVPALPGSALPSLPPPIGTPVGRN